MSSVQPGRQPAVAGRNEKQQKRQRERDKRQATRAWRKRWRARAAIARATATSSGMVSTHDEQPRWRVVDRSKA
ncbi:hypothetical protein Syun_012671 [Stephania yunnanensis]|uniref:Uncharacterized protein n=1 Tax=Stephania yunnanensis TaxID=152371 RepID=A0AAP0JZW6_9MAGN